MLVFIIVWLAYFAFVGLVCWISIKFDDPTDIMDGGGAILVTIFMGGIFPIGVSIACAVAGAKTMNDVPLHEAEREVLLYRLDNQQHHIVEDMELYEDILSFNSSITRAKTFDDNIWVGWFIDRSWADVEPIELPSDWEL